jgi:hypothetical protein
VDLLNQRCGSVYHILYRSYPKAHQNTHRLPQKLSGSEDSGSFFHNDNKIVVFSVWAPQ